MNAMAKNKQDAEARRLQNRSIDSAIRWNIMMRLLSSTETRRAQ